MIVITGAAGFIASRLAEELNTEGYKDLILVDDFSHESKKRNWEKLNYNLLIDRNEFIDWFEKNAPSIDFVYHLGARTDTTEFDWAVFEKLNFSYSKAIWSVCTHYQIPLVYASSAATYGDGGYGYDDEAPIENLSPLNPYGKSKQVFDLWVAQEQKTPPFWAGLKFFNVYGGNEFHKGRMASVIFHAYNQIKKTGGMKLFRSHRPDVADGNQSRDFIYVKDVVFICLFLMLNGSLSGIYNVGTGKARTFLDLVKATFSAMNIPENISFIDTPLDIRDKYQYFTEASMKKLKKQGYSRTFYSLEEGVADYVQHDLMGRL